MGLWDRLWGLAAGGTGEGPSVGAANPTGEKV